MRVERVCLEYDPRIQLIIVPFYIGIPFASQEFPESDKTRAACILVTLMQ